MFHYQDGQLPRTPEPDAQLEDPRPPPPPRQVLKVRRRRTTFVPTQIFSEFNDPNDGLPVPTIEGPELHPDTSTDLPNLQPTIDTDYLSPALTWSRMLSPPKTPVSQMGNLASFDGLSHWSDVDQASQSETSSRPTSSSGFSDSSVSSVESFESFPSLGGSCTSPEDEKTDPFVFCSPMPKQTPMLNSPLASHHQKKLKLKATFTEEMDYHLWMTYMRYLQDPTVTPFKALPTTVPPNGVCHRVARLARHTWKGPRKSSFAPGLRTPAQLFSRNGTPDTVRPARSGSNTPLPGAKKPYPRFPQEKQVRRRLRYLAKQKPTLSAHYQRLLHRSPSPFQSSPPPEPPRPGALSSPFLQETSFSTRDMNVSLVTSTATSMQFGNPLSQLAIDKADVSPETSTAQMRASAHQKSQSLHVGLGLGLSDVFGPSLDDMTQTTDIAMTQPNARTWHAAPGRPPKLGSPVQLHAPRPISRAFKRRALHNFEDHNRARGNSFINHVFGAPAESSHRRVRSRGFSLGDMGEGARRLPLSTSGPAAFNPFANLPRVDTQQLSPISPERRGQSTIRLGSPFGSQPSNTFPRALTSHGFEPPASFEQRFAALPSNPEYLHRH